MTQWEYMFIDLWRGGGLSESPFPEFDNEVQRAGAEGWEAVGEIAVSYRPWDRAEGYNTTFRQLMLKRPKS